MRAVVTGVMAAAVLLVQPSPVAAQWRWLEKLSGPGPFVGMYGEIKVDCVYKPGGEETHWLKKDWLAWPGVSGPCWREKSAHPEKRWFSTGVGIGLGVSLENNLSYAEASSDAERRVINIPLEAFADYNLCVHREWNNHCRRFEVGASAGVHLFDGFGRISRGGDVVPFSAKIVWGGRVTYRLKGFGLLTGDSVKGALKARIGFSRFTKGFTAEDFGAVAGSWSSGPETVVTATLLLDFDRFRPKPAAAAPTPPPGRAQ